MTRRIALFANTKAGLAIFEYLIDSSDSIRALFLAGQNLEIDEEILHKANSAGITEIYFGDFRSDPERFRNLFIENQVDTLITVYWPFIIPERILEVTDLSVNFHPALLPHNRGWYPHVHNILEGSEAGVTLHQLAPRVDEGDIWTQRKIVTYPWDLASDLYLRLQSAIIEEFIKTWPKIRTKSIEAYKQSNFESSYHSKEEVDNLDLIDLERVGTFRDFINLLRARTFGDRGFAYFFDSDGNKVSVQIRLIKNDF